MRLNICSDAVYVRSSFCGPANVRRTALRGIAVNSGYLVRRITGCVSGCRVNSGDIVAGMNAVTAATNTAFNRNAAVTIVGRTNRNGVYLRDTLATRATTVVIGCTDDDIVATTLHRLVAHTVTASSAENDVNPNIEVGGARAVVGAVLSTSYRISNTLHLTSDAVRDATRTPACVNTNIVVSGAVVLPDADVLGGIALRDYFISRTYYVGGNFYTRGDIFYTGDVLSRNRTTTTLYNPFATSRRHDALLVNASYSFFGTNTDAVFSGRTCGVNPVRSKSLTQNDGATVNTRVTFPTAVNTFSAYVNRLRRRPSAATVPFSCLVITSGNITRLLPKQTVASVNLFHSARG